MSNEELINIAKLAWKNSVTDISGYGVGAALLAKSGTVYLGANIEDKGIPSQSNCAERVALQNAMAHGERDFEKIAIIRGKKSTNVFDLNISPCGVCLQYMLDFCSDIKVVTYLDGELVEKDVKEFLKYPYIFEDK